MSPEAYRELCFTSLRSMWRARVGRMPRGYEAQFRDLIRRFKYPRIYRAIAAVAEANLRRTIDRWRLFLALFGEAP